MKILVISGFLGAGKTTFIRALSEKTGKNFAVMENEYGETGIDGTVLQQDRLKVWELTEGCICCSLQSDFAASILTIANTADPEYLVVEPTGVGFLSAVMRNIGKIEYERIRLLEPLTLVDVHCVDAYIREFGELYTDQIKNAPRLVLSKGEHLSETELARITALLRNLNPQAEIISTAYTRLPQEWWEQLFESPYNKTRSLVPLAEPHLPDLENAGCTGVVIDSVAELMEILVALMRGYFGSVYRVKGSVPIQGQWTKFDVTDKRYTLTVCSPMPEAKVIVIGRQLNRSRFYEAFRGKPFAV
ncbi:MAG: GTP-binding protein [Treponema sp.]